jgi:hypothetical protein
LARLRSIIDPSKATPLDQVRVRVTSSEVPAAVASDPLDAITAVSNVLDVWHDWGHDLQKISNDKTAVGWFGAHVLDRHKPDDGIRALWSVQDAADRWGVERVPAKSERPWEPDDEVEYEHTPVTEWFDPLLTLMQAAGRVDRSQRTVRKWIDRGDLEPRTTVRFPDGTVQHGFYASEVDRAAEKAEARRMANLSGRGIMTGAAWQAAQQSITDAQVEAAARAEFEHVRARRPADHGPYSTWEQQDDEYREYCRRIARAGLEAALVAAIEGNKTHG